MGKRSRSWGLEWVRRRSMKVKALMRRSSMEMKVMMGIMIMISCLVGLKLFIKDGIYLLLSSQFIHLSGLIVLIYNLIATNTCPVLSLKTHGLTAMVLAAKVYCSFEAQHALSTVLNLTTLVTTLWLIYMIKFKLKPTYVQQLDSMPLHYLVVPSAILAVLIHPQRMGTPVSRIGWSFSVCLECVSLLPQLRLMQNAKMVEPFSAYYVGALGIARVLNCSYWVNEITEAGTKYLLASTKSELWVIMLAASELVHIYLLGDFCYYYTKSVLHDPLLPELSSDGKRKKF